MEQKVEIGSECLLEKVSAYSNYVFSFHTQFEIELEPNLKLSFVTIV